MSGDVSLFTFLNQPPYTIQYTPDTQSVNYGGTGKFMLSATVDSSGNATSGTFSVGGFIAGITGSSLPGNGDVGGDALDFSLLTGNLLEFGFQPSPDGKLEFVFQVTGGDLAPLYSAPALMVFNQFGDPGDTGYGFPGDFHSDFTTGDPNDVPQYGVGDIGSVPEPGSILMFASAFGLLALGRHKWAMRKAVRAA